MLKEVIYAMHRSKILHNLIPTQNLEKLVSEEDEVEWWSLEAGDIKKEAGEARNQVRGHNG